MQLLFPKVEMTHYNYIEKICNRNFTQEPALRDAECFEYKAAYPSTPAENRLA
jgi:hypothetical protein